MHRDALITSPDLHRALALPHLHRGPYPLPVDAVPGALPADETVPGHLAVLPQVRRQRGPIRQLPQVGPLLGQHLPGHPVGRPMHPRVGHHVAPLQSLPVQVGVVGETDAGPHVAPHVLDPVLHLALGLGSVGLAQPGLKTHPPGEIQHPLVPDRPLLLVPAQRDHLGVIVKAPAGHAAQVLEGIHVALDEGGRVRLAHQLHVAGSRPAQCHHKHPDAAFLPVCPNVGQTAPVHLRLLTRRRLKPHRRLRLPTPTPRPHVLHHRRIAALVAQGADLPIQHPAILQSFRHSQVDVLQVRVQLRPSWWPRLRPHRLRRFQIPAHRVPGNVQLPGNLPDRTASAFQLVYLFHLSHL